jgi:hypothetical protein
MDDWLKDVLSRPTASIQEASRACGYGKNAGYDAVENGTMPTIDLGTRKKRVPTSWLRQKLGLGGQ